MIEQLVVPKERRPHPSERLAIATLLFATFVSLASPFASADDEATVPERTASKHTASKHTASESAAPEGAPADVPRAPEEGGPRRWRATADGPLELRDSPSPDARIVATSREGTVLSNLGCETVGSRVWCRVQPLGARLRGHVPAERLRPAVGPDGAVTTGIDDSVSRARRGEFDARGRIPCAQERGDPMGECTADVARGGGRDAAVVARFPNGFARTLRFVHGRFVSADATMSGSGSDIDWRRDGDVHVVRVDDQRYVLGDELLFGP